MSLLHPLSRFPYARVLKIAIELGVNVTNDDAIQTLPVDQRLSHIAEQNPLFTGFSILNVGVLVALCSLMITSTTKPPTQFRSIISAAFSFILATESVFLITMAPLTSGSAEQKAIEAAPSNELRSLATSHSGLSLLLGLLCLTIDNSVSLPYFSMILMLLPHAMAAISIVISVSLPSFSLTTLQPLLLFILPSKSNGESVPVGGSILQAYFTAVQLTVILWVLKVFKIEFTREPKDMIDAISRSFSLLLVANYFYVSVVSLASSITGLSSVGNQFVQQVTTFSSRSNGKSKRAGRYKNSKKGKKKNKSGRKSSPEEVHVPVEQSQQE